MKMNLPNLTPEEAAWAEQAEKATPGPWNLHWCDEYFPESARGYVESGNATPCHFYHGRKSDAAFIASARTAVPHLARELDAARGREKELQRIHEHYKASYKEEVELTDRLEKALQQIELDVRMPHGNCADFRHHVSMIARKALEKP